MCLNLKLHKFMMFRRLWKYLASSRLQTFFEKYTLIIKIYYIYMENMVFNIVTFLNIVLVQKNMNDGLILELRKPSVNPGHDYLSLRKNGIVIDRRRKQKTAKQTTTMKQDFACLISRRNTLSFVVFSTATGSCGLFGEPDNFLTTRYIFVFANTVKAKTSVINVAKDL